MGSSRTVKTISRYVCEICETEYDVAADALACEALGYPDPMPFIPLGVPIPAFGEGGIVMATIRAVFVDCRWPGEHRWCVNAHPWPYISHNLDTEDNVPAYAFDPRRGYDAFRYGASQNEIGLWLKTLAAYGFTEADVSPMLLERINAWRKYMCG